MNMPKDVEKDLITLLSRLILEKDEDAPSRLSEQEDYLKDLKCADPALGKWISDCDFPFLIETLALDAATFSEEFPDAQLTAEERKEFANALEAHCETCEFCHSKRAHDLEWQSDVNRAFAENKEAIGKTIASAAGKS